MESSIDSKLNKQIINNQEFDSTTVQSFDQEFHLDIEGVEEYQGRETRQSQASILDRPRPKPHTISPININTNSFELNSNLNHDSEGNHVKNKNVLDWKESQKMNRNWSREGDVDEINNSSGILSLENTRRSSFFGLPEITDGISSITGERDRGGVEDYTQYRHDGQEEVITTSPISVRPSSFYGLEGPPNQQQLNSTFYQPPAVTNFSGATKSIASSSFSREARAPRYHTAPYAASRAASLYASSTHSPSDLLTPVPLLDHSHLQPGILASLLSHEKTLDLYRANVKKTNDPDIQFEFCTFVMEVVSEMESAEDILEEDVTGSSDGAHQSQTKTKQAELVLESVALLNKLANRGHVKSQYFLGDCYTQGIGTVKGKRDYDKAFPLFVLAGKHGHVDACYRAAQCCENGWGCKKDFSKAVTFLRRAAALTHPGAMYRLGIAELKGELGLTKRPREGVKWLKRSAEIADQVDPPQPQSLHELAILHENGIENVVFKDEEYAAELLARAAELQYSPSAFKLGECYEYGKMGCPQDSALSIHYYNIAAQQEHREACFALTAWYLVGSPGVLPQSDTEAYLWARKAADMGLAKAEYAVGYFTEVGIGTPKDIRDSLDWFKKAAEHGDKRAKDRLRLAGSTQHFSQYNNQAPAQPLPVQVLSPEQQDPYAQFYETYPSTSSQNLPSSKPRYQLPQSIGRASTPTAPISRTQRRIAKDKSVQIRPHSIDRHTLDSFEVEYQKPQQQMYSNSNGFPARPTSNRRQRSYSQPDPTDFTARYMSSQQYAEPEVQQQQQQVPLLVSTRLSFDSSSRYQSQLNSTDNSTHFQAQAPQASHYQSLPYENSYSPGTDTSRFFPSREENANRTSNDPNERRILPLFKPIQAGQIRTPVARSDLGSKGNRSTKLELIPGEKRVLQRGKKDASEEKDCLLM